MFGALRLRIAAIAPAGVPRLVSSPSPCPSTGLFDLQPYLHLFTIICVSLQSLVCCVLQASCLMSCLRNFCLQKQMMPRLNNNPRSGSLPYSAVVLPHG